MSRAKHIIVKNFNSHVTNLVKTFEDATDNELDLSNLNRLRKRIALIKSTLGDDKIIELASPIFLKLKEEILNRDESFFMNVNVRSKAKNNIDQSDEFVLDLVDMARKQYRLSSEAERDYIYSQIKSLFTLSVEFLLKV